MMLDCIRHCAFACAGSDTTRIYHLHSAPFPPCASWAHMSIALTVELPSKTIKSFVSGVLSQGAHQQPCTIRSRSDRICNTVPIAHHARTPDVFTGVPVVAAATWLHFAHFAEYVAHFAHA